MRSRDLLLAPALYALLLPVLLATAQPIAVKFPEGSVHGYLALRSLDGKLLAAGDVVQTIHGNRLTSRLIYRFKDGSIDDDTAVFVQSKYFRLLSDHRVQKGPTFPRPTDLMINAVTGEVTVRYTESGKEKVEKSHLDLPADLANGLLLDVVKNLSPREGEVRLSYLAATPKPQLVHLSFTRDGSESFRSAGLANRAVRYRIHVDVGGIEGFFASVLGKAPADSYVWISLGEVPAFIRSETPLYFGGPSMITELVSPVWARTAGSVPPK